MNALLLIVMVVMLSWLPRARADAVDDAWMQYDILSILFSSSSAVDLQSHIDELATRYFETEKVINSNPALLSTAIDSLAADSELIAMEQAPEWLHGIDVVTNGLRQETTEKSDNADRTFPNGTDVWIVGWDGLILHSSDEGVHWERQDSGSTKHLVSVDFVDPLHGFVVGYDGIVLQTTTGGLRWGETRGHALGQHFTVDCIDTNTCWLGGVYQFVYNTSDGGKTWKKSSWLRPDSELRSLQMLSSATGVAVGNGIWITNNAGEDWSLVYDPVASPRYNSGDGLYGVHSADGLTAWAVGKEGGQLAILKSEDAGKTWVSQSMNVLPADYTTGFQASRLSPHNATSVFAASESRAFVGATNGVILATMNGGENWWVQMASGDATDSFHAIAMRDERVGWVVGNYGNVVGTNSGGRSWYRTRGFSYEFDQKIMDLIEKLSHEK